MNPATTRDPRADARNQLATVADRLVTLCIHAAFSGGAVDLFRLVSIAEEAAQISLSLTPLESSPGTEQGTSTPGTGGDDPVPDVLPNR
ncbi:hypothetical protein [Nocardia transvalensis]|uniref:hypothetical protein n=1 Tax=Nocardia transvalensis TaxID=37333 RepID=UPI0018933FE6|nr:hypothetical protein [Nocardia transvalensis]MBF6328760.1 hypothetical protein [Nocardia transvalensis]